jgi:hypothetical protein
MSDTPKTDKHLSKNLWSGGRSEPGVYEFARALERENAELKAEVEQLKYERDMFDIEQVIQLKDELWRDNLELKRQRLEARQEAIKWQTAWVENTALEAMGSTVMPWMNGWEMDAKKGGEG